MKNKRIDNKSSVDGCDCFKIERVLKSGLAIIEYLSIIDRFVAMMSLIKRSIPFAKMTLSSDGKKWKTDRSMLKKAVGKVKLFDADFICENTNSRGATSYDCARKAEQKKLSLKRLSFARLSCEMIEIK